MWNSLSRGSPASGDSWKMDTGTSMFCHNNLVCDLNRTPIRTGCLMTVSSLLWNTPANTVFILKRGLTFILFRFDIGPAILHDDVLISKRSFTGILWGESTSYKWKVMRSFDVSFVRLNKQSKNNRVAGDSRRPDAHVTSVQKYIHWWECNVLHLKSSAALFCVFWLCTVWRNELYILWTWHW